MIENVNLLLLILKGYNFGRVVVQGLGPGPRYGHVMSLVGQRFLLSISGNDGAFTTLSVNVIIQGLNELM